MPAKTVVRNDVMRPRDGLGRFPVSQRRAGSASAALLGPARARTRTSASAGSPCSTSTNSPRLRLASAASQAGRSDAGRVAFAVHAWMLARGYRLTAVGDAVDGERSAGKRA